jgi:predicted aldo/keto reductase-like oxidoreductase
LKIAPAPILSPYCQCLRKLQNEKIRIRINAVAIKDPNDYKSIEMDTLNQMVDTFLERGFTYFDTLMSITWAGVR